MDLGVIRRVAVPAALLAEIRDEWVGHALSTEHADRAKAEAGVRAVYRAAKLEPPRTIVWLGSPLAGVIGSYYLEVLLDRTDRSLRPLMLGSSVAGELGGNLGLHPDGNNEWVMFHAGADTLVEQVDAHIRPVRNLVAAQVILQPRDPVWESIGNRVEDMVRAQAGDRIDGRSWAQVWDPDARGIALFLPPREDGSPYDIVRERIRRQYRVVIDGQCDAGKLADHEVNRRRGKKSDKRLPGLLRVAKSAGPWWPLFDTAVLTERPTELHRDDRGRPHCADGPAVRYPDGWSVYAWHGVRVPADLVEGGGWSIERIRSEPNSEIRRCAVEWHSDANG